MRVTVSGRLLGLFPWMRECVCESMSELRYLNLPFSFSLFLQPSMKPGTQLQILYRKFQGRKTLSIYR